MGSTPIRSTNLPENMKIIKITLEGPTGSGKHDMLEVIFKAVENNRHLFAQADFVEVVEKNPPDDEILHKTFSI